MALEDFWPKAHVERGSDRLKKVSLRPFMAGSKKIEGYGSSNGFGLDLNGRSSRKIGRFDRQKKCIIQKGVKARGNGQGLLWMKEGGTRREKRGGCLEFVQEFVLPGL